MAGVAGGEAVTSVVRAVVVAGGCCAGAAVVLLRGAARGAVLQSFVDPGNGLTWRIIISKKRESSHVGLSL